MPDFSFLALGTTGLVGSHFLQLALNAANTSQVATISRRPPHADSSDKLDSLVSTDTDEWPELVKKGSAKIPEHSTVVSAFGSTRAVAKTKENFIRIDHGINMAFFKAAKETGKFDTAVIVSTSGADASSRFYYLSTKAMIEEDIKALKFKRTIILRPSLILGKREKTAGFVIDMMHSTAALIRKACPVLYRAPSAEEIAKAALYLSEQPLKKDGEVRVLEDADIVNLVKEKEL